MKIKKLVFIFIFFITSIMLYSDPCSVSSGGTGLSSATAYGVLCGGTMSTAPLQVVTYGAGSGTKVLISQGAGAVPIFTPWFEYAYIYSRAGSAVTAGSAIPFELNGLISSNISHSTSVNNTQITINRAGTYLLEYHAATTTGSDGGLGITINGGALLTTSKGVFYPAGYCGSQVILSIAEGDVIRVINSYSTTMDFSTSRVSASITIMQIA